MPVSRATTWVDDTEVLAHTGPAYLKAIVIDLDELNTSVNFVQLWNSVTADPGTTAPYVVLPVTRFSAQGRKGRRKYVFPQGLRFGTGISWMVTTTHDGETAPVAPQGPLAVEIHYEPCP